MKRISVRLIFFFCLFMTICFSINIHAEESNKQLPAIEVENNIVTLTYKTAGFNNYTYNGRDTISCSSSDPDYVKCSVDKNSKKILLTPIKTTNHDITITLNAGKKTKMVKNNANIKYEDENEILLQELMNPVVKVESMDVKVPDTGSNITIVGIAIGVVLIGSGGYALYRKYNV